MGLRLFKKKEKQEHKILRQIVRSGDRLQPEYHRPTPECPHPERWSMFDSMTAEAEVLDRLGDSDVLRALRELPSEFRVAIYLADIEGYPYREVAEMMGTPIGTVMSRLHRGRAKLRQRLAGYESQSAGERDAARQRWPEPVLAAS